jgi:hypothetical protein
MSQTEPIPAELTQGTNLAATVNGGDYPATSYTGALTLHDGTSRVTGTVTASGSDYLCTLTTTQTAAMRPGVWTWQLFVSSGSTRQLLDSGIIKILPDLAENQIPAYDSRSASRKMLETFNKLMGDANYVKTLAPEQIAEMERVRKQAEWDVKREDDAAKLKAGGYPTRKILTRFT